VLTLSPLAYRYKWN